jgi:hypothetical protein
MRSFCPCSKALNRSGKGLSIVVKVCIGFWCGNLRERDHWEDPGIDGRIILKWNVRKWGVGLWTGLGRLRIGTGGGHL